MSDPNTRPVPARVFVYVVVDDLDARDDARRSGRVATYQATPEEVAGLLRLIGALSNRPPLPATANRFAGASGKARTDSHAPEAAPVRGWTFQAAALRAAIRLIGEWDGPDDARPDVVIPG